MTQLDKIETLNVPRPLFSRYGNAGQVVPARFVMRV